MIMKWRVTGPDIRCKNIISRQSDKRFGLTCNRFLMEVNSRGEAAGKIKCPRCGAIYEIKKGELILLALTKKED